MMKLNNGDIVLVNFEPSVGREYKKIRPAVVIQSDKTISKTALITVMPITSQIAKRGSYDVPIVKSSGNGLYADSLIKVECIHSFDKVRLQKIIGKASKDVMAKISTYLRLHFEYGDEKNIDSKKVNNSRVEEISVDEETQVLMNDVSAKWSKKK